MLEDQFYISKLITGHLQGNLDVQQQREFAEWIAISDGNSDFLKEFYNEIALNEDLKRYNDLDEAVVWNKIVNGVNKKVGGQLTQPKRLPMFTKLVAAASLILVIGLVFYLISRPKPFPSDRYANDIDPGGNKAILKLSNGKQIVLTGAKTGMLANESNVVIKKSEDGTIVYGSEGQVDDLSKGEVFNVMETPKGGNYTIGLADGTKITLNAASSLKFPVSFKGKEQRIVELTGEAYFEVAKNRTHPFVVKTGKESIQVLGTHFNVKNYIDEESIKTTLLEGSVMINGKTILKPGEQAIFLATGLRVNQVDTELAVAWKNNKFMFERARIQDIMKMVERWYNVEVIYEGEIPNEEFGGSVSRFDKVSKVLNILELTGNVHFQIEGRRIIVMK